MKHVKKTLLATALTGTIIAATSFAIADYDKKQNPVLPENIIALTEAATIAMNTLPGNIYEAELEFENDQPIWEIEIVTLDNERFEIEIDAQSGEVLSEEKDDH